MPYKDDEKRRAWKRAWKKRNRDKVLAEKKKYRDKKRGGPPQPKIKHGHTVGGKDTPEYRSYMHAKMRCNNPRDDNYPEYGGRGIEFKFSSFEEFYEHLGPRPKGTTLDRINNDGHYELNNVRWGTHKQQANNTRRNKQT